MNFQTKQDRNRFTGMSDELVNDLAKHQSKYPNKVAAEHDFSDLNKKLWLVKWIIGDPPGGTWETLKDIDFHHYCASNKLNVFLSTFHPQ